MNYEEFKKNFCEAIKNNFSDWEFKKHPIINEVKDAVKIEKNLFFIEDAYNYYKVCNDFQIVIERLKESLVEAKKIVPVDLEINKENIVMQLINKEKNKELLKDIPYRDYLDLAIIYRAVNKNFTSLITNSDLEKLALDEDKLFLIAKENTQRIFPTMIIKATELEQIFEKDIENIPNDFMFFLTNIDLYYGAINIIYDNIKEMALKYNKNLYILPSSIHDLVVILDGMVSPEIIINVHNNIQKISRKEDFLSNNVYYYDREKNEFSIIKTLDENERMIMSKTAALIEKFKGEGII